MAASRRVVPWIAAAAIACGVAAHAPLLIEHAARLWAKPHYQFFPLILVGAGALAARALRGDSSKSAPWPWLAAVLFIAAAAMLAAGEIGHSPWLGAVSAWLAAITCAFALGGWNWVRRLAPAWLLLLLLIPLPANLDERLIGRMQSVVAQWSGRLLDHFNVLHLRAAHVIELPGRRMFVAEACSGIQSLYAGLACTLFYLLWRRTRVWIAVPVLVATAVWIVAANTVRIVAVVYLARRGIDATTGWRHDTIGVLVFAGAMLLSLSTERLLSLFVRGDGELRDDGDPDNAEADSSDNSDDIEADPTETAVASGDAPHAPASGRFAVVGWTCALAVYLAVITGHAWLYGAARAAAPVMANRQVQAELSNRLSETTLDGACGDWRRAGYSETPLEALSPDGVTRTWNFERGGLRARVTLDYPFMGWHELPVCYYGLGWFDDDSAPADDGPQPDSRVVAARLQRQPRRYGYLMYTLFDESGRDLHRPDRAALSAFGRRFAQGWRATQRGNDAEPLSNDQSPTFQVQLFVDRYVPLSRDEERACSDLFERAVAALKAACVTRQ